MPLETMKRLELLDYARLVAALAVVAYHYLFSGIALGTVPGLTHGPLAGVAKYGYLGVELFFVISGYVIFYTARGKTAGEFAVSRAVRLYPAFWVAVLFTASVAAFWGGPKMSVEPVQVLVNLTMIPAKLGAKLVDSVYWTLYVELTFYAAVMLLLVAGQGKRLDRIFLWWPALMLAAAVLGLRHVIFLGGYYPFFAAGALFAMLRHNRLPPTTARWVHVALMVCFVLACLGSLERAAIFAGSRNTVFSPLAIIAIIACHFAFFFALNSAKGQSLHLPGSRLAGGLTYPIYLVHAHFGYMLLNRFANDDNKVMVYPLVMIAVLVVAFVIHSVVERRLAVFWNHAFSRVLGAPIDALQARLARTMAGRRGHPHDPAAVDGKAGAFKDS